MWNRLHTYSLCVDVHRDSLLECDGHWHLDGFHNHLLDVVYLWSLHWVADDLVHIDLYRHFLLVDSNVFLDNLLYLYTFCALLIDYQHSVTRDFDGSIYSNIHDLVPIYFHRDLDSAWLLDNVLNRWHLYGHLHYFFDNLLDYLRDLDDLLDNAGHYDDLLNDLFDLYCLGYLYDLFYNFLLDGRHLLDAFEVHLYWHDLLLPHRYRYLFLHDIGYVLDNLDWLLLREHHMLEHFHRYMYNFLNSFD